MRIVQFNKNAIPSEYPANFRKTALVGDVYVGEYSGSDAGIADYLGTYPIPDYSYMDKGGSASLASPTYTIAQMKGFVDQCISEGSLSEDSRLPMS